MPALPSSELLQRYGGPGPRYTSYPAATEWTPSVGVKEAHEALRRADAVDAPLSLYVHIPFCVEMCRFCGCNVIATRDRSRGSEYLDTLETEVALWAARLPNRRQVSQIHLGGGTPTFLNEEQLQRLDSILRRHFTPLPDAELAIEVDPEVTTVGQIQLLGRLGFNRISMGVQDLNPTVQEAIGRIQSPARTLEMIEAARSAGFRSINLDLMYGLPFQTPQTIRQTMEDVLAMQPDRLALFGYAHVPWMKPNQRLLPQAHMPGPAQRAELFLTAAEVLASAGFVQVGLDHFARSDDELAVAQRSGAMIRNFQGYSARGAADTVAFGVSSISDVGGVFLQNNHRLSAWQEAVESGTLPVERGGIRTADDELRGAAIQTLMCLLRLDVVPLKEEFGQAALDLFAEAEDKLRGLEKDGLIARRPGGFDVLPLGRLFLRSIAMVFDAYLERHQNTPAFSRAV